MQTIFVFVRHCTVILAVAMVTQITSAQQPVGPVVPPTGDPRPAQAAPVDAPSVHSPFRLTPEQESYLDRVLIDWERHMGDTKNFKCEFTRWNYNPDFEHPQYKDMPIAVNRGNLKYASPDKGTFRVNKVQHLDINTGKYADAKGEHGEHWVCDGKSIWEYDHKTRRVVERRIPEELQGKALRHTPLPFLFGSEATELKSRYFLRIVTPKEFAEAEIWVDAFPRKRADLANFQRAVLRLNRKNFHPVALRIYNPGNTYASYEFSKIVFNDRLATLKEWFQPPRVPFGWRRVLELPAEATAQNTRR